MSTAAQGRLADTVEYAITQLRASTDLVNLLEGDDSRVYPGTPTSPKSIPIGVAVSGTYGGGSHRGQGERLRMLLQATVIAQREWRETNSSLEMHRILDEVGVVLGTSNEAGLVPLGSAGGTPTELEVQEGAYVALPGRWRFQRTQQNHTK